MGVIGEGEESQELVVSNRVVRNVPGSNYSKMTMGMEADQRHADLLVSEFGLDSSSNGGVEAPRVKKSEKEV